MASCLTTEEYEKLQTDLDEGNAEIIVSRNFSRQFFFNVGNRNIQNLTGESMVGRKSVVVGLLLFSLALAALCLALVVREFGSWATVGVPLVGIFWTVLAGFSTEMGSFVSHTLIMASSAVAAWFLPQEYAVTLIVFGFSMYCFLLAHLIAEVFMKQLLRTSFDAYDMLCEQIDIEHHAS